MNNSNHGFTTILQYLCVYMSSMDATYILFFKKSPFNALIYSLFQNFEGPAQFNFRGKLISEFAAIFMICYKLLSSRETWLERKKLFSLQLQYRNIEWFCSG